MLRKILIAVSLLLAAGTSAVAAEPTGDIAHEVLARWLTLPTDVPGTLQVKVCDSCTSKSLEVTADVRLEIGRISVGLAEMRRELNARPGQLLLLQLTPDLKQVDRIKIPAAN